MIESNRRAGKQHIAVFAFPFGGHARPLLGLVHKLATAMPDARFSFFNTRASNEQLFSEQDTNVVSKNIKPYDVADGVPPNHVFSDNPHEPTELFLKEVPENFKLSVDRAVLESGVKITSFVADSFLPLIVEIADEMRVPCALLWVSMPYVLYVYLYVDAIRHSDRRNPNNVGNPNNVAEIIPGVPSIRVEDLPDGILVPGELGGTLLGDILDKLGSTVARATAIVVNFYHELDLTTHTDFLMTQVPNLLCLGFLSLSSPSPSNLNSGTDCLSWLDKHEPGSVAYISFGTVVALPPEEQRALAEALEASNVPYLWSLGDKYKQTLPAGFLERTATVGKTVPWAPQTEVLKHASVGVFVTHCGSNSVYESITSGVPMICRPFFGDHRMNARIVEEEWGIGLTFENGVVTKNGVAKSFEVILGGEEGGKEMKERALALKELVKAAAGPRGKAVDDLKVLVDILS